MSIEDNIKMKDLRVDNQESLQEKSGHSPEDDDISIEGSDDGNYEITPEDMVIVYRRVAEGDLELNEKLVRVRSPSPDMTEELTVDVKRIEDEQMEEIAEEKPIVEEFDFDSFSETSRLIAPRRSIGSVKTPRNTHKRVAQWDKIMNDYMKYQKLEEKPNPPKESTAGAVPVPVTSTKSTIPAASTTPTAKNIPINVVSETDLEMVISIGAATVAMTPPLSSRDENTVDAGKSIKPTEESSKNDEQRE